MSKNIKLKKISIYGMIFKMSCKRICRHIICRFLDWCKFIYFLISWDNNNTTRMLSCTLSYTGTSSCYSVDFNITLMYIMLFKIILYITKCCFISYTCNGSCSESMSFTKHNFCICVGICLIFTRKV